MRPFRFSRSSTIGLLSIMLLYILLIVLILILSNQMLKDIAEGRSLSNFMIIPLAVVLPVFLIGSIIYNVVKLFRERAKRNPGVRFKIRLIIFFSIIAFLSAVPQGILSLGFIDTTVNSWFSNRLGRALQGGLSIALEYHNEQIENLKSINESNVLSIILQDIEKRPDRIWKHLSSIDRSIESVQIFDERGNEILFEGEEQGRVEYGSVEDAEEGLLPKEAKAEVTIIRTLKTYSLDENNYRVVISKVLPQDFDKKAEELTSALAVFKQLDEFQSVFRLVLVVFYFFFSFPILLLAILASFLLSEEIIRPIVNIEDATKRVAEGDFSIRILARPHDELAILIRSFNQMVSELEHSRLKTMQTEKVSAWQEIAQRMAHEIKNPLTPIKLSAQRLLRKYEQNGDDFPGILKNSVSSIIREVDNLTTMLQEFRDFARLPAPQPEPVNLKKLLHEVTVTYDTTYPNVTITIDTDESLSISVDRSQIYQVFTNLVKNGTEAASKHDRQGEIYIRADLVTKGNLRYCRIQIQDNGSGIDADNYDQVFNPYFTTKKDGTGLGLPIVERIVADHNGQIWFESEKGVGTTFFVDLPVEER